MYIVHVFFMLTFTSSIVKSSVLEIIFRRVLYRLIDLYKKLIQDFLKGGGGQAPSKRKAVWEKGPCLCFPADKPQKDVRFRRSPPGYGPEKGTSGPRHLD